MEKIRFNLESGGQTRPAVNHRGTEVTEDGKFRGFGSVSSVPLWFNLWPKRDGAPCKMDAFTLVELIVVIATLAMVGALALPVFAKGQQKPQAYGCLNNQKQLALAAMMYAEDNRGSWLPNQPGQLPTWAAGFMTFVPTYQDNTNEALLVDKSISVIAPYAKSARIFKCPADNSFVIGEGARVRSVSMNQAVGTVGGTPGTMVGSLTPGNRVNGQWLTGNNAGNKAYNTLYRTFGKTSDMNSPANIWVFADEHPNSIVDAALAVQVSAVGTGSGIIDFPGSYHDGACGFSFADGHAEIHKWLGKTIQPPMDGSGVIGSGGMKTSSGDSANDLKWLQMRTSSRFDGTPLDQW